MSIPEFQLHLIHKKMKEYCKKGVPGLLAGQVSLSYEIIDDTVGLFEERIIPGKTKREVRTPIARFRFDEGEGQWHLFYMDRNGKWLAYNFLEPALNLDDILKEIKEDFTRVFWG